MIALSTAIPCRHSTISSQVLCHHRRTASPLKDKNGKFKKVILYTSAYSFRWCCPGQTESWGAKVHHWSDWPGVGISPLAIALENERLPTFVSSGGRGGRAWQCFGGAVFFLQLGFFGLFGKPAAKVYKKSPNVKIHGKLRWTDYTQTAFILACS